MKKLLLIIVCTFIFFTLTTRVFAIENPLDKPNNRFGIHILFTEEIFDASKIINSNGGDWGYVTIPIQAGDRNLEKWQKFLNDSTYLHVIPIIRLATEGDYFNTRVWRKPNRYDIVDFANFLNSLDWSTKNRYIIVFNEPNRGDEWGDSPDPADYADILNFAIDTFKNRSDDFFILSAGMDNASANVFGQSFDEYSFLMRMNISNAEVFSKLDGMASHSYPNPAFLQPPSVKTAHSITSFLYEKAYGKMYSGKDLPIFITETGWDKERIPESTISEYLTESFSYVWNDSQVVAVTPFLLKAGSGPFERFSFLASDNSKTQLSQTLENLPKIKGEPDLIQKVLGVKSEVSIQTREFNKPKTIDRETIHIPNDVKTALKWLIKF